MPGELTVMFRITPRYTNLIVILIINVLGISCAGGGSDSGDGQPGQQQAVVVCGPVVDIDPASSTNGTLATSDCTIEACGGGLFIRMPRRIIDPAGHSPIMASVVRAAVHRIESHPS